MEIAAIHRLAGSIAAGLLHRDPLSEKVHLSKPGFAAIALVASFVTLVRRPFLSSRAWPLAVGGQGR
jgi:hypothetical protein